MTTKQLLNGIPWAFYHKEFKTLSEFLDAMSEYRDSLDLKKDWPSSKIAVKTNKLNILIEEVYDEKSQPVDLSLELVSNGSQFTNGELLFSLHNSLAKKMKAGYQFGDHCFFEGLHKMKGGKNNYVCYLGS